MSTAKKSKAPSAPKIIWVSFNPDNMCPDNVTKNKGEAKTLGDQSFFDGPPYPVLEYVLKPGQVKKAAKKTAKKSTKTKKARKPQGGA